MIPAMEAEPAFRNILTFDDVVSGFSLAHAGVKGYANADMLAPIDATAVDVRHGRGGRDVGGGGLLVGRRYFETEVCGRTWEGVDG